MILVGALIAIMTVLVSRGPQKTSSPEKVNLNWPHILARYIMTLRGFIFNRFPLTKSQRPAPIIDLYYLADYYTLLVATKFAELEKFSEWLEKEMNPQALSKKLEQISRELQEEKQS